MAYILQTAKSDTLNVSGLAAGASSATLSTGSFGSPTGTQLLVVDYNVPAKLEVISCTIAGTALTSITRGLDGTSDVAHSASAAVIMAFVPSHYTQLGAIAASDAWTSHTPTFVGFSAIPTGYSSRYMRFGSICVWKHTVGSPGTSDSVNCTLTLPVPASSTAAIQIPCFTRDSGTWSVGTLTIANSGTTAAFGKGNLTTADFTTSGNKDVSFEVIYPV